jgi:acyl-CoA thioesterase
MNLLEATLALQPAGDGLWRGVAPPEYEAMNGMFGGWTAAFLLNAVLQDPATEGAGSASSLTVHYIRAVPVRAALLLRTQRLGGGRSLSHWRVELMVEGSPDIIATAAVVLANRRDSDGLTVGQPPSALMPEPMATPAAPAAAFRNIDVRYVSGGPPFSRDSTRSIVWERERSGRILDAVQLAFLSDLGMPRAAFLTGEFRTSATVTLSLYIHATPAELDACGDDHVLTDMVATRIESATVGSKKEMWSRSGRLLATTEQLCWFR